MRRAWFNSAGREDGGRTHESTKWLDSRSWKGKKPSSLQEECGSANTLMLAEYCGLKSHGELLTPHTMVLGDGVLVGRWSPPEGISALGKEIPQSSQAPAIP